MTEDESRIEAVLQETGQPPSRFIAVDPVDGEGTDGLRAPILHLQALLTSQAAHLEQIQKENDALKRQAVELHVWHTLAEAHMGGCQSPHGGKCGCGWSLINAEFAEFDGEAERAAWLRAGVKADALLDTAITEAVETTRRQLAEIRENTPENGTSPRAEHPRGTTPPRG